jgi:hypothetical protein
LTTLRKPTRQLVNSIHRIKKRERWLTWTNIIEPLRFFHEAVQPLQLVEGPLPPPTFFSEDLSHLLSQRFNVLWVVTQLVEHVDYSADYSVQATEDCVRIAQAYLLRLAIISFGVV